MAKETDENKPSVSIESSCWEGGIWNVRATICNSTGTRSGPHQIEGPEDMSEEALKASLLSLY